MGCHPLGVRLTGGKERTPETFRFIPERASGQAWRHSAAEINVHEWQWFHWNVHARQCFSWERVKRYWSGFDSSLCCKSQRNKLACKRFAAPTDTLATATAVCQCPKLNQADLFPSPLLGGVCTARAVRPPTMPTVRPRLSPPDPPADEEVGAWVITCVSTLSRGSSHLHGG